jgi:hypothetical protein
MKQITELSNIGLNKKCLIVGNGYSKELFDYKDLEDFTIFGINKANNKIKCHYVIYYDKDMKEYYDNKENIDFELIGFKHKAIDHISNKCSYEYSLNDVVFGDSGLHILQIADKIMRFKEIYLIGYDYKLEDNSLNYFDKLNGNREKIYKFLIHSNTVLQRYYQIEWENNIYNLNEQSILKRFAYKNIKE